MPVQTHMYACACNLLPRRLETEAKEVEES